MSRLSVEAWLIITEDTWWSWSLASNRNVGLLNFAEWVTITSLEFVVERFLWGRVVPGVNDDWRVGWSNFLLDVFAFAYTTITRGVDPELVTRELLAMRFERSVWIITRPRIVALCERLVFEELHLFTVEHTPMSAPD